MIHTCTEVIQKLLVCQKTTKQRNCCVLQLVGSVQCKIGKYFCQRFSSKFVTSYRFYFKNYIKNCLALLRFVWLLLQSHLQIKYIILKGSLVPRFTQILPSMPNYFSVVFNFSSVWLLSQHFAQKRYTSIA